MMIALRLLFEATCILSIASFCFFIFLACKEGSNILYERKSRNKRWSKSRVFTVAFVSLAAICLFVCVYSGIESLLFWLPSSYGSYNDDGDFVTIKSGIASTLSTYIGIGMVLFVDKAIKRSYSIKELSIENQLLIEMIDAWDSEFSLVRIIDKNKEITSSLIKENRILSGDYYENMDSKTGGIIRTYEYINHNVSKRLEQIRSNTHPS